MTGRYFLKDLHKYLKDIPDADIYLQKLHCEARNIKFESLTKGAVIVHWIHQRLPTCDPRVDSPAQYQCFFNLYLNCELSQTKN